MPKETTPRLLELKEELQSANVIRAQADARKAIAEADKAERESRDAEAKRQSELDKIAAETEKLRQDLAVGAETLIGARYSNTMTRLRVESAELDDRNIKTNDFFHHRYVFDRQVNSKSVEECISRLTTWVRQADAPCKIEIVLNTPGGEIFPGMALIDYIELLQKDGHTINTTALGMAASMGAVILQAGNVRKMGRSALLLIHEASFGAGGSYGEVMDVVKSAELLQDRILDLFASRTGELLTREEITKRWTRRDWWMNATEALELGLIDEIA